MSSVDKPSFQHPDVARCRNGSSAGSPRCRTSARRMVRSVSVVKPRGCAAGPGRVLAWRLADGAPSASAGLTPFWRGRTSTRRPGKSAWARSRRGAADHPGRREAARVEAQDQDGATPHLPRPRDGGALARAPQSPAPAATEGGRGVAGQRPGFLPGGRTPMEPGPRVQGVQETGRARGCSVICLHQGGRHTATR